MNNSYRREFMKRFAVAAAVAVPCAAETGQDLLRSNKANARWFFNIVDFGALGDGKTICTTAIQNTVDACAQHGGGKVIVPAGRFLTGPIFLKSNIEVELLAGATLAFTTDIASVPSLKGRWEGIDRTIYASLLTGTGLENVAITGHGTLDGQGETWWRAFRKLQELRNKLGLGEREPENPPGAPLQWGRPRMINLNDCKNITITGLRIINSPSWAVHPVRCDTVLIDGLNIAAPSDSPNTDGIDPDSCRNVRIANCHISVGDDCIIIKSGYSYRTDGVPSENITVTNCTFGTGHCGVGVGSETAGGVKDIAISNCVCDGTDRGLRFKTARGRGSTVENIRASNVVMRNVREAVTVTMFYAGGDIHASQPVDQYTPAFRRFHFSDIIVEGAKKLAVIEGLPEMPVQDLRLSNIMASHVGRGITCANVNGLVFDGIVVEAKQGAPLSAHTVRDLEISRLVARGGPADEPAIRLENVTSAVVHSCAAAEDAPALLQLKGPDNRDISLRSNRLPHSTREIECVEGASETSVVRRS
jgi:hypothetical protein